MEGEKESSASSTKNSRSSSYHETKIVSRVCKNQQPITAGLEEDVEMLIYKVFDEFEKHSGPRFNIFTEIWHQTGMGLIFCGRESFREMFEFTEELFLKSQKYAMSVLGGKTNHPLVRYAAIYLLYSLYFKQPCRPRVKIRLLVEELEDILQTTAMAKRDHHWDVLYAWSKLFTGHAFHYVACRTQMGLEVAMLLEIKDIEERNISSYKEDYFKSKDFSSTLRKLSKAHSKYMTMKKNLASPNVDADKSLFLTDSNFPQTLRQQQVVKFDSIETPSPREKSAIGEKRRGLKYKYFGVGGDDIDDDGTKHDISQENMSEFERSEPDLSPGPSNLEKGKRRIISKGEKSKVSGGKKSIRKEVHNESEELDSDWTPGSSKFAKSKTNKKPKPKGVVRKKTVRSKKDFIS